MSNKTEPLSDEEYGQRIARETMTGDLRDCILDFLKHDKSPLPWNLQGEEQQINAIEKVDKAVAFAVERAVQLIASDGKQVISGRLDQINIKDEIKATILLTKTNPNRHQLYDCQGTDVLILVADPSAYEGERQAVAINPLQGSLPVDDDDNNADKREDY